MSLLNILVHHGLFIKTATRVTNDTLVQSRVFFKMKNAWVTCFCKSPPQRILLKRPESRMTVQFYNITKKIAKKPLSQRTSSLRSRRKWYAWLTYLALRRSKRKEITLANIHFPAFAPAQSSVIFAANLKKPTRS